MDSKKVDQPLTRGEFIIYLYESLNNITQRLSNELNSNLKATAKDVTYMGDPFGDLWPDSPYYQPARDLVEFYNIDVSWPEGTFRPEEYLTRGDFAVYLLDSLDTVRDLVD